MRHIETSSKDHESVDETIKRVLKLVTETKSGPPPPPPLTTTIKVSRMVMNFIKEEANPEESRDQTLARLFGIEQDDGNVKGK